MANLQSTIELVCHKEALQKKISTVVVALSGGADSVAATCLAKKIGLNILALHCNFHLRGEESNRDMQFVSKFCSEWEIPLEIKDFSVEEFREQNPGNSLEMACRQLRHLWFREKQIQFGADRIVTGHNADDNIETFFLNALRGSGTRGLKGMDYDNGTIWRPLLKLHHGQIHEYLANNNLGYIVDSTNLESDFRRNFIRNKIIPLLKNEWPGFDKSLDTTLRHLHSENRIIETTLEETLPSIGEPLSVEKIISFPAPILLIKRFLETCGPYSTTASEVWSSILAKKPHIRIWKLKNGNAVLRHGKLFIEMGHSKSSS